MQDEAEAAIALERLAASTAAPAVDRGDWRLLRRGDPADGRTDGRNTHAEHGAPARKPAPSVSAHTAPGGIERPPGGTLELDLHPLLLRLANEPDAARGAARFQATLAAALIDWVEAARRLAGCATVVLSGGCLHNRLLADALHAALPARGFEVLGARRLSPGDAGLRRMKYVDEFRDGEVAQGAGQSHRRRSPPRPPLQLHGVLRRPHPRHLPLRRADLLPENVRMIHGPGCPVCVLPIGRIDLAIKLALERGVILCTYADTVRVPASGGLSLMRPRRGVAISAWSTR
jgi:hypothetical protein